MYILKIKQEAIREKLKSIDLFTGIGGIRLGFDQSFGKSLKTVFISDWDVYAQKTYRANYHDSFDISGDITVINENDVPPFDICLAGFPCQAFSLAGQRKGLPMIIKECHEALCFLIYPVSVLTISPKLYFAKM